MLFLNLNNKCITLLFLLKQKSKKLVLATRKFYLPHVIFYLSFIFKLVKFYKKENKNHF